MTIEREEIDNREVDFADVITARPRIHWPNNHY